MTEAPDVHDIEGREHGPRELSGLPAKVTRVLAFSWSVFHLLTASKWALNAQAVRSVHLAFAMALVYLSFPVFKKGRFGALGDTNHLPWWDILCAILGPLCALYVFIDWKGLSQRIGNPHTLDIVVGTLLLVLLLDAARRAVGPALPIIGTFFILYSLFSESFPGVMATAATPWSRVIETLSLSTDGIYGIPLGVSASKVFLFVLFGALLEKAGGGKYFIDLAFSLLGGFRGGPAKASVLASGLTGMINGSSIANTVTTGTFTIPLMKRTGFPAVKAGAIEVASSTNGQLMPPIMGAAAFIIAETCLLPYAAVVKAAFVPAVISYLALVYITHLEALKLDLKPVPRSELPRFKETLLSGAHFLVPIAVLLYLLIIIRKTAQYSALGGIIALAIVVVWKHLLSEGRNGWKTALPILGSGMVNGAKNMMTIGVAVAAAGIIVGVLSLGLSSQVTEVIRILSGGTLIGMLLVTAVVSLILGMGLPTTATYIVMASLTAKAIEVLAGDFGVDLPLIGIHLFVFYFGILSDDTPPVGLSAYAASAISRADPIKTGIQGFLYDIRTALLPFMFLFNHRLLLMDVEGPVEFLWVFLTAMAGMFAFAAATQGFLRRPNKWWDTLILLFATWILFRPGSMERLLALGPTLWSIIGLALFGMAFLIQKRQPPQSAT